MHVFSQTLTLTIEAWDSDTVEWINDVIDVFVQNIDPLASTNWQTVIKSGHYGIGLLNFSYYIQQLDLEYTNICKTDTPAGSVTNQPVTSSPADTSLTPTDNTTNQQVTSSLANNSCTPNANSTIQQVNESCSSPWAWIVVAILFLLLTILFFTISIALFCINRKMAKKLKENKKGSPDENDGK